MGQSLIGLNPRQMPRVWNFAGAHGADVRRFERDYGGGAAFQSHEFNLERLTVVVDVNDRANIAGFEPFRRKVCGQHNAIVFFCHSVLIGKDSTLQGAAHASRCLLSKLLEREAMFRKAFGFRPQEWTGRVWSDIDFPLGR